ncbi:MAG: DUF4124 domain-containing protein [Betaproteobacteria bacterium]|nr:DUF4124 domain-containing protein [Betaproteobacteria bacterium]
MTLPPALTRALCLLGIATLLAAPAAAQFKWVDENGRTVYSDQPPPPGRALVKQLDPPPPVTPASPPAAANPAGTARPSPAERERLARQRTEEGRKAAEKQAEEARRATELRQACADRQADLRVLDSGTRVLRVDANGERAFMSDEEISRRRQMLVQSIQDECRDR